MKIETWTRMTDDEKEMYQHHIKLCEDAIRSLQEYSNKMDKKYSEEDR